MKEPLSESFYLQLRFVFYLLVLMPIISEAQRITIIDKNHSPIEGVSVYKENSDFIGISDYKGKINLPDFKTNTNFTFLLTGYKTKIITQEEIIKNDYIIILEREHLKLDKVIIIGRNQQYREDIISETDIINQKEIQVTNSISTADALAMSGNIFVQKSQFGGGSPVLRGFEANRVLLVLDGVRMNNAIYRNGHLQNSITVDNFSLKRIEVIFGPGSLTYGSDAIGGVIHFKTKDPVFNTNFSQYKFRYSSAAKEKTGYISVNMGLSKFASTLILSSSSFSDLRAGDNRPAKYPDFGKREYFTAFVNGKDTIVKNENYNIQKGTGFSQLNMLSKSIYQFNNYTKLTANIQYSTSSNIPRYDFLTEMKGNQFKYSEWYYGPQTRLLGALRLDLSRKNKLYDNAVLIAALQKINEDRISRKFGSKWKKSNKEELFVFSLSIDLKKYLSNKNHEFVYGLDFQNNNLNSSGSRQNIFTGERKNDILTRYPSDLAQNYRMGSYLQYVFGEKDYPFQISLGSRIETNHIFLKYKNDSIFNWDKSYYNGVKNNNTSFAFSIGGKYRLPRKWKISGNVSTAFRNPNIDDLGKIRIKKGEILVPNLDLKTEKSNNIELSVKKEYKLKNLYVDVSTTGFYTILNGAIIRDRYSLPDGNDIYIDGNDTLLVMANQNIEQQRVFGFSIGLNSKIKQFTITANMVYTKGDILEADKSTKPAAHIPPLFGNVKLGYKKGNFSAKYIFIFNAAKPINLYGGPVDNPENATIDGTYAWSTHNVYLQYKLSQAFDLSLAFENILDIHYRTFSSGVSSPGRNIIVSVSGKIFK